MAGWLIALGNLTAAEFYQTKPNNMSTQTSPAPRVLRLTLKREWFYMIARGEKKEEYRKPGKWILSRLEGKDYDRIEFKNGYGPNVPTMEVAYRGWEIGFGQIRWGAGFDELAVIHLGRVISIRNLPAEMPL